LLKIKEKLNRPNIISLGEVLWDLFPTGPRFGGAPANFACHAAALGARVSMVSAVGQDDCGSMGTSILENYGIDVSLVAQIQDSKTGVVTVEMDTSGKPTFTIEEDVAWDQIPWSTEMGGRIDQADVVYFGSLAQRSAISKATIQFSLERAKTANIRRVLDINLRLPFFNDAVIQESIELCNFLKFSDDELESVSKASGLSMADPHPSLLQQLMKNFDLELVVMTRGADGALLVSANEVIDQPGFPAEVRDTVGAGDAFTASIINGVCEGAPLAEIAAKACHYAARICELDGAVPDVPSRSEP
tara:strand:+ start:249 stop:1157 length:909 start_codon:yes stop_codon:yes gene_type:complete